MKLLAPNGKPSKLTPEQYRLVRTPAFKAWFGDWENSPENASKVVDENGEPLVVYHGTYREFNVFEITREGGWFFTEFKRIAQIYAETVQMGVGSKKNEKPIIIPAFLNIRNISIKNFYQKVVQRLSPTIKSLKNKGYDGLLIKNGLDVGGYYDQYVSFKSSQIKLADGTNTTFDSNNPDIRFGNGGRVEKLAFIQKNENGFYWLYAINDKGDNYKDIDGDKRLYVVKDMAERFGYKLVSAKQFNDFYKIDDRFKMYENRRKFKLGGTTMRKPKNMLLNSENKYELGGEITLALNENDKEIRNDKDYYPYDIIDGNGKKLGYIELMYRSDLDAYQISNSSVKEKGKGIGKKAYMILIKMLDKPIYSDSSLTEDAKNLWKSLVNRNYAHYDESKGKYKTFMSGGEITLTTEQVENKLGRKLHWWNDDVVFINGIEYKKVFLKPEYKRL